VSAPAAGFVADSFRWGSSSAPWYETVFIVCVIVAMAIALALAFRAQRRQRRRPAPVHDQWQAFAAMGELCPHGWRAQITVYGRGAPTPEDLGPTRLPPVELEWAEFDRESRQVAGVRRFSARTIGGALQMMVDDRRTDVELAQLGEAGPHG
jgi:hypothetical protein